MSSEVCIEPNLRPATSDQLSGATANSQDGVRLDVSANGVWGGRFFDVRVSENQIPSACYRKQEKEKNSYCTTLWWLRCHLTFSLISSAIQTLRGARSSQGQAAHPSAVLYIQYHLLYISLFCSVVSCACSACV